MYDDAPLIFLIGLSIGIVVSGAIVYAGFDHILSSTTLWAVTTTGGVFVGSVGIDDGEVNVYNDDGATCLPKASVLKIERVEDKEKK